MPNPLARRLRVLANPYHALDVNDRPIAAVLIPGTRDRYIGAELDAAESEKAQGHVFRFTGAEAAVPITPHYFRALQDGALLAADKITADIVGLPTFGAAAIADAKSDAHATHLAWFGPGSKVQEPLCPKAHEPEPQPADAPAVKEAS